MRPPPSPCFVALLVAGLLACGGKTGLDAGAAAPSDAGPAPEDTGMDAGDLGPPPTLACFWLWGAALSLAEGPALTLGPAAIAATERVALLTFREGGEAAGRVVSADATPRLIGDLEEPVVGDRAYGLRTGFLVGIEGGATCTFLGWSTRGEVRGFAGLATAPCLFGEARGDLAAHARRDGSAAFLLALDAAGNADIQTSYGPTRAGETVDFMAPAARESDGSFVVDVGAEGSRISRVGMGSSGVLELEGSVRAVAPDPLGPALLALARGPGGTAQLLRVERAGTRQLALPDALTDAEPAPVLAATDTQAFLVDAEGALWAVPLGAGVARRIGPPPEAAEGTVRELELVVRPGGDVGGAFLTVARGDRLEARWRSLICER